MNKPVPVSSRPPESSPAADRHSGFSSLDFRIAYLLDAFPRRTENFILREVTGAHRFWPRLKVYCFKARREDWRYVDREPGAGDLAAVSLRRSLWPTLLMHARWLRGRRADYIAVLVRAISLGRALRLPRRFLRAIALADQAAADGITHLHIHFAGEPAIIGHLAARALAISYSLSAHAHDVWAEAPLAPVLAGASCVLACSGAAAARLKQHYPGAPVGMVHHGLTPSHTETRLAGAAPPRPAPPPLRIISAGRLIGKKGFDTLIEACGILSRGKLDFRCDIYGEGELKQPLENQIRRLGLTAQVALHPFVPFSELGRQIRQAQLFVLPSRIDPASGDRDGIPNVLLEAQAGGAIVIAGDSPAARELVDHQVSGFLVEPDSPLLLARLIDDILARQENWPELRRRAHEKLLREFCLEANLSRFKGLIEASLAQGGAAAVMAEAADQRSKA